MNQAQKPQDHIPRTPEEAMELFAKMSQDQKKDVLEKTVKSNEKILDALKVVKMFEAEGWPIFSGAITELREMIGGEAAIAFMTGNIFEKGAKVENLQGRMAVLESIQTLIDEFKKQARQEPVDLVALEQALNQEKN